ncbi:3-oxoacyl-[acyl-carrier-protein] synthase III C-terminal domain-containing protein [Budvicia diplopodorum]|uniref:3-oxoacyl-[acyl-carrier-protein] synthase III C-terminal domain-containing protein n=1 Tax=Budvicia diplopodorum TaxID=1119056 RepID=UPI001356B502|nr:3-oxoacyl-[acyl-carrier-protein] synthase III C-terminal domain-containing protein [Budvicia diplopodorum]
MTTHSTINNIAIPLKVISTGIALPETRVFSSELDRRLNKSAGYVEKHCGIEYRFHAPFDLDPAVFAAQAIYDALRRQQIKPESIDLLISASAIPIQALPYSAAHILKASSLPAGIACFDINTSCVSFVTAMHVAASLLASGGYRRIAIVSAELPSRGIDWNHRESSLIFGDGAACAIVERGDGQSGIVSYLLETYPEGIGYCEIRAGGVRKNLRSGMEDSDFLFHMDGKPLFKTASGLIDGYMARLLAPSGLKLKDMATVIPHQASHLSLEHMRRRLGISPQALIDIYRHRGNQVSASIPSALHEARLRGKFEPGHPAMLIGTAAGLSFGGMILMP